MYFKIRNYEYHLRLTNFPKQEMEVSTQCVKKLSLTYDKNCRRKLVESAV